MTGADKIISSIIEEAEKEAKDILAEATLKAEELKKESNRESGHKAKEILKEAKKTGEESKRRILAVYGLELKKELLAAKRSMLNEAYDKAFQRLLHLSKEEYLELMKKLLLKTVTTGDESVILSKEECYINREFLDTVNDELNLSGKEGKLKLSGEKAELKGGFILKSKDLSIDCSLETLIKELRDKTESLLAQILFG
ncbi:MAG: V-type ATP synthase subunit E family protein [Eubacteriales bacterium]